MPNVVRPLRASDVHDSRVRRIATITPDMVCPKTARLCARPDPAVRESSDNIPKETRRVRVQTVNVNPGAKKGCQRPVEPKPPVPRSVAESDDAGTSSARITAATIICAMRSPRLIGNGASP